MSRFPWVVPLVLLLVAAAAPAAAEPETTWMKVMLEGRKIGQIEHVRTVESGRVTTIERMAVTIERAGTALSLEVEERSVETADGKPLAFGARTSLGGTTPTSSRWRASRTCASARLTDSCSTRTASREVATAQ